MKIGILTFHRSINYGAVTQCYALVTEIKKRFPNDSVEVIDYVPQFRQEYYRPTLKNYFFGSVRKGNSCLLNVKIIVSQGIRFLRHPKLIKLLQNRYSAFQNSMEYLPLSNECYIQNDCEDFRKEIFGKYDIIVVGSDQIWSWKKIALPNAYYLHGDYGCLKMSYAASVATDDFLQLEAEKKELLRRLLSDFSYIGVRDTSTEFVVDQLMVSNIQWHHNCDPTTFLDTDALAPYKEKVRNKVKKLGVPEDKKVIAVMGSEKYGKMARQIFGDEATYIALYVPNRYCDYQFLDLTVLEWASSFALFDLTFTTFFHGTMLSLVNNTPVLSFDTLPETENQITKLRELYNRLGLQGFYHRDDGDISAEEMEKISQTAHDFVNDPPKAQIAEAIKKEASTAESFFQYIKAIHKKGLDKS